MTDNPADYAATERSPGVAFADLRRGVPEWLTDSIASAGGTPLLVLVHWGPNMNPEPLDYVRSAASHAFCSRAAGRVSSALDQVDDNDDDRMHSIARLAYNRGEYGHRLFG